jgi:hypothetical protein
MNKASNQTPGEPAFTRIRLGVWLLVPLSGLIILAAICLRRSGTTSTPALPAQPDSATPGHDTHNAPSSRARLIPASEPMQKTLVGWVLDLDSTNAEIVQAARKALADLGPAAAPAIPQLAQMLKEGRNCNAAAYTLASIGTNALPVLIDALTNGNPVARLEAAGAMGGLGEAAEAAVPALVECMHDENSGVRGNAIAALQSIPKRPDVAVPALIAALADPDAHDNADTVLRKYAQVEAETTISLLIQASKEEQNPVSVRFRAAEIVRAVAPERAKAEGL